MSFRGRLLLFFFLIVVLPMGAVAVLVVDLTGSSRTGKADAALAAGLQTALELDRQAYQDARAATRRVGSDARLGAALDGDRATLRRVLTKLARGEQLAYLRLVPGNGKPIVVGARQRPIGLARLRLRSASGPAGTIEAARVDAGRFVADVRRLTGNGVAIAAGAELVSSALFAESLDLPPSGASRDGEAADGSLRLAAADLPRTQGLRVVLATEVESAGFLGSSPLVAIALGGFFLLAIALAMAAMRAMRGQIAAMLGAARQIGSGDFSGDLPVVGNDELANLASEFNKMSGRLERQIAQLRSQRLEISNSLQQLGDAIAAGLDREALLEIVVDAALASCEARYGRAALSDGTKINSPAEAEAAFRHSMRGAELDAREGLGECSRDGAHAIAAPLVRIGSEEALGVLSIARDGEPFSVDQRDLLVYLASQASASISNIELHEEVSEQAVTDELTGLSNKRAFSERIELEASRAERFGHDLSLIILDIDDFKQVNDTYGHLLGDEVLRVVGRVLDGESRDIDEAARYGGEEFVVALPETGIDGAGELAERIRARIEREEIAIPSGRLHVTASLGTATLPGGKGGVQELIATADRALYQAKRSGKNRVEATTDLGAGMPHDQTRDPAPRE